MTRQQISTDVKEFIADYIRSVFQLEILLLLHETSSQWWVASEVSSQLGIETEAVNIQLSSLADARLVKRLERKPASFIYQPAREELKPIIDRLAVAYSQQRVAVLSLILKKPDDRIQRFAEAFKLTRST